MSFADCINEAGNKNLLSKDKQQSLTDDFADLSKNYENKGLSKEEADRKAGIDLFNQMKLDAAQKIKEKKASIKIQQEFEYSLKRYTEMNNGIPDPATVMRSFVMDVTIKQGFKRIRSVEEEIRIIEGLLDAHMNKILKEFSHNIIGVNRNKATLQTMGREIFQEGSTGNKNAQELATAWKQTAELARRMFNDAGGKIPKLDSWYLPQSHNELLIRDVPSEEWIRFLIDEDILDVEGMFNFKTGKTFTQEELQIALGEVHNNIATFGRSKKQPIKKSNKLSNRRIDHRFLKFRNYDAWEKYMNKYGGNTNVYDIMLSHLKGMARDIATMRRLSPDPERMMRWMEETAKDYVTKNLKIKGNELKKLRNQIDKAADDIDIGMHIINGQHNKTRNPKFTQTMAGLRDLTTAAYLGSATFLAFGDFNLSRISSQYIGMSATKTMSKNLKMFASGLSKDSSLIKTAMTSGLTAEYMTTIMSSAARVSAGETGSPQWTKRAADIVLKTSGLSWLTQAGRWGAGTEMMGFLSRVSDQSWDELATKNSKFHEFLSSFNITRNDWDSLRSIKKYNPDDIDVPGAEYLRPIDILDSNIPEEQAMEIYSKFQAAINNFVDFAVPVAKVRGQLFLGKTRPGTLSGEILRSMLQFKQFPLTFHFTHIMRIVNMANTGDKIKAGADLLISTTLMGALAYELKQITKGKKPTNFEDMDEKEAMAYGVDKMLHGGGLGFIGDILTQLKYGAAFQPGASLGVLGDVANLTAGNVLRYIADEDPNVTGQLMNFVKKNTPGASTWYGRLALERRFFDVIQEMIDRDYYKKRKRLHKRAIDENTEFWWSPGDKLPSESPF
jgi:hypothetical protein